MIKQEFKAQGTKYQVLQNFGICCRELGDSKLPVFAHVCEVSALSCECGFNPALTLIDRFLKKNLLSLNTYLTLGIRRIS